MAPTASGLTASVVATSPWSDSAPAMATAPVPVVTGTTTPTRSWPPVPIDPGAPASW